MWLMGAMNTVEKIKILASRVEIVIYGHRCVIHFLPGWVRQRLILRWGKRARRKK